MKYKQRKIKGGYIPIARDILKSDAYIDLHIGGKAIIPHLANCWHSEKQEAITYSARQVADVLNVSKSTGSRILKDLIAKGFINTVAESDWINGKARAYKLNWLPYHGKEATDEWREYVSDKLKPTSHPWDGSPPKRPTHGTVKLKTANLQVCRDQKSITYGTFSQATVPPQVH